MPSVIDGDDGFVTSSGGIILQTRYKVFDGWTNFSVSDGVVYPLDFLAVNITPKSEHSVFKLELSLAIEAGVVSVNIMLGAKRNDYYIANSSTLSSQNAGIAPLVTSLPDEATETMDMGLYTYVDAPNTSSPITYVPTISTFGSFEIAINRTFQNGNSANYETALSTFIVTELSGT